MQSDVCLLATHVQALGVHPLQWGAATSGSSATLVQAVGGHPLQWGAATSGSSPPPPWTTSSRVRSPGEHHTPKSKAWGLSEIVYRVSAVRSNGTQRGRGSTPSPTLNLQFRCPSSDLCQHTSFPLTVNLHTPSLSYIHGPLAYQSLPLIDP